ncbi:MAG: hypothetical protein CMM77_03595 [Rhodospirillaceae bacterium]|nr:hypothetical protein [Magnetovibrio sp.]MAY66194.1 hypothetical protein [Rhodospirillaceae bacterium]
MTDLTPKRTLLNAGEGLLLLAIRAWRGLTPESTRSDGAGRDGSARAEARNVPPALADAVAAFLDLLWRSDPFIVRSNPIANNGMTLFELQTIYALAEWRKGNHRTVHELLAWWFPDTQIAYGRALLAEVSEVLDDLGIEFQPSKWVHAHFLGNRPRQAGSGSVVPTGTRMTPPGVLWAAARANRTLH